jgi:DNA-binding GntR family transcriptional regulator
MTLLVVQDPMSLREKTLAKLREAIISGYFGPGEQLVERDICQKADVSRTSLREALRHLESEGLVVSKKGQGVFVATLSREDLRDIYEVRLTLDAEAAFHFTYRATDAQRKRFNEVCRQMTLGGSDDERRSRFIDFFEVLHEGSGNRLSAAFTQTLRARTSLSRAVVVRKANADRRKESVAKVLGIAEAIDSGDGKLAADRCREFVARSMKYALEVFRDA